MWIFWCVSVNFVRIFTIISYFWSKLSARSIFSHVSTHYVLRIRNYSENSDKINQKTPKYLHYGPIFWKRKDEIFWKLHIYHVGGVSWKPLSTDWVESIVWKKIRTRALCKGLCSVKLRLWAIALMKWSDPKTKNYLHKICQLLGLFTNSFRAIFQGRINFFEEFVYKT